MIRMGKVAADHLLRTRMFSSFFPCLSYRGGVVMRLSKLSFVFIRPRGFADLSCQIS